MSKEYTTELLIDFGNDGQTLLPVVTQDYTTKEVLILAFVNKEAFDETRRSGYATYWSRSRSELWKKGAQSFTKKELKPIKNVVVKQQNGTTTVTITYSNGNKLNVEVNS